MRRSASARHRSAGRSRHRQGIGAIVANRQAKFESSKGRRDRGRRIGGHQSAGRRTHRLGHSWVYRSDVRTAQAEPGAVVRLTDERGRFQGRAFYSDKSQIAVRLLTREDVPVDRAFFTERLRQAIAYRAACRRKLRSLSPGLQRGGPAALAHRGPLRRLPRRADAEPGHRTPQEICSSKF